MSDFGSLLNQFQRDAKQWTASADSNPNKKKTGRSTDSSTRSSTAQEPSRKRPRTFRDAASFPPVREVFLVCPANVQTGGPEALHQLCDQLNRSKKSVVDIPAYMAYAKSNGRRVSLLARARKPIAYESLYKAPVATNIDPITESPAPQDRLLVWPECWTDEMIDYLENNSSTSPSPCAIWWLSVDNNTNKFQEWNRNDILHLYQSEYAKRYLLKHGAKHVLPMTEYISNPPKATIPANERTIDVLYNPLKGIHYTDAIRKRSGRDMVIRPIGGGPDGRERISPEQVRELLSKAKIYIDFGPHPGMDRLPREAALAGCLILTNRQGAAAYEEDVPLSSKYKLREFRVDDIHRLLMDLLENFEERSSDFEEYREWIRSQPDRMEECVTNLLNEIVTKRQDSSTETESY